MEKDPKYKVTVTTVNNEHDLYACYNWRIDQSVLLLSNHERVITAVPLFNVRSIEFKPFPESLK